MRSKITQFTSLSLSILLLFSACQKNNNSNTTTPPHITSFYPQSGVRGTAVLIGGSNFSTVLAENKVTFNGKEARLISTTGNSLMVEVPVSPGIGRIAVTVNGHTDSSASSFNYQASVCFVAGSQTTGSIDGSALNAQFNYPNGIVFDNTGNLLIVAIDKIRKLSTDSIVSTIAGGDTYGSADGPATSARFESPYDLVPDGAGNIYVTDTYNQTIRKITKDGMVSTIAGSARLADFKDGQGAAARFNSPEGITIDQAGNLYVADAGNNCIRKITPDGNVSVFAGTKASGFADGTGLAARFNLPTDIVIDAAGNLYVSDAHNYSVRKITPSGDVATITGNGVSGYKDGPKTMAQLGTVEQLCLDKNGNLLLTDYGNNVLRKVSPSGEVTTIAGIPQSDISVGPITKVSFQYLNGIAVAPSGLIYFTDRYGIKTFY